MNSLSPEGSPHQMRRLFSFRRYRVVHYAVTAILAAAILFVYYAYKESLPAPSPHYLEWFWSVFYFEFRSHVLGILMLVPILYSAFTLGWKRSTIATAVLLAAIAPYIATFSYSARTTFESFSLLVIPPALVIAVEMLLISNAKERRARAEKKRERAEVMRQMFSLQEDERRRISQDLHDSVAQTLLVNASTAYNMLEGKKQDEAALKAGLEAIKENSLGMVAEIRNICQDLRPSVLDNLGLVSAIKWLVDNFSEETGTRVELSLAGEPHDLTQDENVAVFRMVQEVLSNIRKHSGADHVSVNLEFEQAGLTIVIKDNGQGFQLVDNVQRYGLDGKLGILGMHERAQSIGALLRIDSTKGRGTKVTIRVTGGAGERPAAAPALDEPDAT
jgi:two-component system sensor histidine kinase DegS